MSEFYWYTALERRELGCRDYAQGLGNGTASGAPCRLSVVPAADKNPNPNPNPSPNTNTNPNPSPNPKPKPKSEPLP